MVCKGVTALFYASIEGSLESVQILVNAGVDVNLLHKNGDSALSNATCKGNLEMVKFLIENGADIEKCGCISSTNACILGKFEIMEYLIEQGIKINIIDTSNEGKTPLHHAVQYGFLNIIKLLLDNGAEINLKDYYGNTAFDLAKNIEIKEYIQNYNFSKFVLK